MFLLQNFSRVSKKKKKFQITISELSSLLTCVHKNYDDRKNRTAKKVCVTNVTGLSLTCFVVIFILHRCFPVVYKKLRPVQRIVDFGGRFLQTKLLSRLSQNVCRLPFSPVLLRKFAVNYLIGAIIITKR